MRGFLQHLRITLRLNFRSPQAIVYGYLVPIFFLLAFGSIFKTIPPLVRELGQLLTITTLGGACFGMPTAMVSERERGVWRRYRLLPTSTATLVLSTMLARLVLVGSAAILQIILAKLMYGMPMPMHPAQLAIAFLFVAFAFLGMGLVIAMLSDNVPAVQALGQSIFLPMIIIGGVGVPLRVLPPWAQHVAGFLPGRYAVQALESCVNGPGLSAARFSLAALLVIGAAACVAGERLFRWDAGQKPTAAARAWAMLAILAWVGVGVVAEARGKLWAVSESPNALVNAIMPTTTPATEPTTTSPSVAASQPATTQAANWQSITDAEVKSITYDDLEPDDSTVTPIAHTLDNLPEDTKSQLDDFAGKLANWDPGQENDPLQRIRNLLAVAAVPDVLEDANESYIPLLIFQQIQGGLPREQLIKILTWIALNPDQGMYPNNLPELGFDQAVDEATVRQRAVAYGRKLLGRMLGKWPPPPATQP